MQNVPKCEKKINLMQSYDFKSALGLKYILEWPHVELKSKLSGQAWLCLFWDTHKIPFTGRILIKIQIFAAKEKKESTREHEVNECLIIFRVNWH